MNSAHDFASTAPDHASAPLASWYTQGLSDGFGDRLVMFDNTGSGSLELLRFRPEIASLPAFENALRQRVRVLKNLKSQFFPAVHSVEYLDGHDSLALVSTHLQGMRVSEILAHAKARRGIHPAFAAWMIRRATVALSELHQLDGSVSHGTITPERILVTADGRLFVVEHALGSALDQLQLTPARQWAEFSVMTLPGTWAFRQGRRTDIMQLGLVALSTLLGRRVTPGEYPHRLEALLDEFTQTAQVRAPGMTPALRAWLERALQFDGNAFSSAAEAQEAAQGFPDRIPAAIATDLSSSRRSVTPFTGASTKESASMSSMATGLPAEAGGDSEGDDESDELFSQQPAPLPPPRLVPRFRDIENPSPISAPGPSPVRRSTEAEAQPVVPSPEPPFMGIGYAGAGFALLALLQSIVIAALLYSRANPTAPVPVQIAVESPTSGDIVMLDGKWIGATPLKLEVSPKPHSIRLLPNPRSSDADAARPTTNAAAKNSSSATVAAATRQRTGGVRLISPIELHVLDGERDLGSSKDGPVFAPLGSRRLDFVNSTLGFRSSQIVDVRADQILQLSIQPPNGQVSINATPGAQVLIDGNPVGDTPVANLSVPLGEHEITFRNPQFGERRKATIVKAGVLTLVTTTFGP